MFTTSALPLTLLATLSAVASTSALELPGAHHHAIRDVAGSATGHHWTRSNLPGRFSRSSRNKARRGLNPNPNNIATGSLTEAEGCTKYFRAVAGNSCYTAAAVVDGLSLDEFYALNPQINGECFNLWTGYDYCVARETGSAAGSSTQQSTSAAPTTTKPVVRVAVQKTTTTSSSTTTTTTTTSAPAATTSASAEENDEDCDAEDEEVELSTSSSRAVAQTSAAVVAAVQRPVTTSEAPTTTQAPTTTTTQAPVTTTTTSEAPATTEDAAVDGGVVSATLPSAFSGTNTNAVLSWFRTNDGNDDTNGNSWCYYPYSDDTPGFAISYKTMMESFPNQSQQDHELAGAEFCGLEAKFTTPDGREALLYVTDAFDDAWVLTPSSADVVIGVFSKLLGHYPTSKVDDVVVGASWSFTGRRSTRYSWRGQGSA